MVYLFRCNGCSVVVVYEEGWTERKCRSTAEVRLDLTSPNPEGISRLNRVQGGRRATIF